jgi:hypothetical protein
MVLREKDQRNDAFMFGIGIRRFSGNAPAAFQKYRIAACGLCPARGDR